MQPTEIIDLKTLLLQQVINMYQKTPEEQRVIVKAKKQTVKNIEKRFQMSDINKIYQFPREYHSIHTSDDDDVSICDLNMQNTKTEKLKSYYLKSSNLQQSSSVNKPLPPQYSFMNDRLKPQSNIRQQSHTLTYGSIKDDLPNRESGNHSQGRKFFMVNRGDSSLNDRERSKLSGICIQAQNNEPLSSRAPRPPQKPILSQQKQSVQLFKDLMKNLVDKPAIDRQGNKMSQIKKCELYIILPQKENVEQMFLSNHKSTHEARSPLSLLKSTSKPLLQKPILMQSPSLQSLRTPMSPLHPNRQTLVPTPIQKTPLNNQNYSVHAQENRTATVLKKFVCPKKSGEFSLFLNLGKNVSPKLKRNTDQTSLHWRVNGNSALTPRRDTENQKSVLLNDKSVNKTLNELLKSIAKPIQKKENRLQTLMSQ